LVPWLLAVAVAAAVAAAAGAPVRATYGAQTTADEPQYLLSALSIATDGDLDIADELAEQRWRDFHEAQLPEQTRPLPGGRRVSPHDPLLPLLLALPMLAGGWLAAKLTLSVVAAALAALTTWTAVRRFAVTPAIAAAVVGIFSVSAPLAVYGSQVYPELPAALVVVAVVAAVTGPMGRRGRWLAGAGIVTLPWLALKYAPVAAALAAVTAWRLWRRGDNGQALGLAITLTAAGLVFAGVHIAVWTGVTPYASGDHFVGGQLTVIGWTPNYVGRSVRLVGLLVDRQFGLAAWQPAWLLGVAAVAVLLRRRPCGWAVLAAPLAAGWLNATFLALTMQGWWFPGRQVVVVLPLIVVAIAFGVDRHRGLLPALAVTGLGGVWTYAWLVVDGLTGRITWVVDFFGVRDPWYGAWSALLPAYLRPQPGTWAVHAAWIVALAAVAVAAWRGAGPSGSRFRGGVLGRGGAARPARRSRSGSRA
jgi:hypothetical protein